MKLFACLHHVIMSSSTRAHFFLLHPFRVHIFTSVEIYGIKGKNKFQFNKVSCQFCMEGQNIAGFVYNQKYTTIFSCQKQMKLQALVFEAFWNWHLRLPLLDMHSSGSFFGFKQTNEYWWSCQAILNCHINSRDPTRDGCIKEFIKRK